MIVLALFVLIVVFGIGYLVGSIQQNKIILKEQRWDDVPHYTHTAPTSSVEGVKPKKKRKPKSVKEWEEEIDLGGNE